MKSLHQLLHSLEQEDGWRSRRQFQALLTCWFDVVGAAVAAHSRPISIHRQVLQVATSSSVWAQTLAFERLHILQKINERLSSDLTDIRFSTVQWQSEPKQRACDATTILWQNHPSCISETPSRSPAPATDPLTAFQGWAERIKARSKQLPICPQCHCPTPQGELKRWSMCSLCATKQW